MDNRDALGDAIDDAVARLAEVRAALAAGDDDALVRWSEQAAADRERLESVTELRARRPWESAGALGGARPGLQEHHEPRAAARRCRRGRVDA